MTKEKNSLFRFTVPVLLVAIVSRMALRRIEGQEPAACTVMRKTLLTAQKIDTWFMAKYPEREYDLPNIPFQVVKDCGWRSWRMPYGYKFTAVEEPMSEKEVVDKFMALNKEVEIREVRHGITSLMGLATLTEGVPKRGPFKEAWKCISTGECTLYFDNSWRNQDYLHLMDKEAVDTFTPGVKLGTMFMSTHKEKTRTASLHASNSKSVALQFTSTKTWEFVTPQVMKKYLYPVTKKAINVVDISTRNETEILQNVPHFTVHGHPGVGIYFPEHWYHIVYSWAGLNTMTNFRQVNTPLDSIKNTPFSLPKALRLAVVGITVQMLPNWIMRPIHRRLQHQRKNFEHDIYREMIFRESPIGAEFADAPIYHTYENMKELKKSKKMQ